MHCDKCLASTERILIEDVVGLDRADLGQRLVLDRAGLDRECEYHCWKWLTSTERIWSKCLFLTERILIKNALRGLDRADLDRERE